jgi:enoyl-CoA hydratase
MNEVEVTREGAVTIIRLNRPQRRNAINGATADALREAWLAFDADDTTRVGILTGGDDVFCAGADLHELESLLSNVEGNNGPLGYTRLFVGKPTIAAIAGYAVAGGLELACWCDLRIADETAVFGCFERRFGVPLIDGGTIRLPQIVGLGRALEMILTGRAVNASEAHLWGLVNEITPRGKHLQRALELAHMLTSFPQNAMLNDRRSVYAAFGKEHQEALAAEAQFGMDTLRSGESLSGAQEFHEGKGRGGV